MAIQTHSGRKQDAYLELILRFPLRPIRNDRELDRAVAIIHSLLDRDGLDPGERDYLEVLGDLVERYESEAHPVQPASDAEMLRHLIEARGVTQVQVARATGIAESTISSILAGTRRISRSHIGKLARYFHVSSGVFLDE